MIGVMITLGITGSIGMGKSTIMHMLQEMGIPTHSADTIVHELLDTNGGAVIAVGHAFPAARLNNAIDRRVLSKTLSDDKQIKLLETIIHPMVFDAITRFKQDMQTQGHRMIAVDIPLLFETESEYHVDTIICVSTTPATQSERLLSRPNMTPEKFAAVLARQMPNSEKCALSDHVIDNNGDLASTRQQLDAILGKILKDSNHAA